ncbi:MULTISPECIES: universal stress protein [Kitasatospora]|uniref:Universal stress protein n=1 Tax=Kitasatospora cystarginea TaxID=58350 RepID=A0ABN3DYU2_9ACTN
MFERGTDGPKVIVVGVDDSDSSWRAAAYAAGLARRQGSQLALVYVQPVSGMLALTGFGGELGETTESVADEIVRQIHEAADRFGETTSVNWQFHTLVGDPFTGLATTADDLRADAVVVGASEQAGHRVMGSLAVRLVKAARWPVTVVP